MRSLEGKKTSQSGQESELSYLGLLSDDIQQLWKKGVDNCLRLMLWGFEQLENTIAILIPGILNSGSMKESTWELST